MRVLDMSYFLSEEDRKALDWVKENMEGPPSIPTAVEVNTTQRELNDKFEKFIEQENREDPQQQAQIDKIMKDQKIARESLAKGIIMNTKRIEKIENNLKL